MATKFTFNNSNSVEDGGAFFTLPGTITVGADAFVYNFTSNLGPNNYNPALLLFNGSYTVTVNGIVGTADTSMFGRGIEFSALTGMSKLTVGASGYVFGGHGGVAAFHPTTIVNAGEIDGGDSGIYEGGNGNWSITNNKDGEINSLVTGILIEGTGIHTITNAGSIYADSSYAIFASGVSDEKLTNSGYIGNDIYLGDGNDVFSNTGEMDGDVNLGAGTNSLTNKSDLYGVVMFGDGNDTLTNSGTLYDSVVFGEGNNTFTNSGRQLGDVIFGGGNDKFTNSGTMEGFTFEFGDGNNTVTNSGTMGESGINSIHFGSGDDKFTNTGTLHIGILELGEGNDTFTGGAASELVVDEGGNDTYKLGAGDDQYFASGAGGEDDIDTADGGAGIDYFNVQLATSDLVINLDGANHFDPYYSVTAFGKTATHYGDGDGDIGLNKISNFEDVDAGDGADIVFGTAGANYIAGNDGDDDLFGLAGNDSLYGDDGEDYLIGGAGKDYLTGGANEDRFIYTDLKDSTSGIAGRDMIIDFEDGIDQIDLSGILIKGGEAHFVGTNVRFGDGQAGDVRAMTTATGWTIQMDAQKDGVPDFAIDVQDLNHTIVWSSDDFSAMLV